MTMKGSIFKPYEVGTSSFPPKRVILNWAFAGRAALDACTACAQRGDAQETAAWASRAAESYARGLGRPL